MYARALHPGRKVRSQRYIKLVMVGTMTLGELITILKYLLVSIRKEAEKRVTYAMKYNI